MALTWIRPATTDVDERWRATAACRQTDPELFFPVGTTGEALHHIAAAKQVCETCPAKEPCLRFAIETNQDSGVWGGTAEEERRALRKQWLGRRRVATA